MTMKMSKANLTKGEMGFYIKLPDTGVGTLDSGMPMELQKTYEKVQDKPELYFDKGRILTDPSGGGRPNGLNTRDLVSTSPSFEQLETTPNFETRSVGNIMKSPLPPGETPLPPDAQPPAPRSRGGYWITMEASYANGCLVGGWPNLLTIYWVNAPQGRTQMDKLNREGRAHIFVTGTAQMHVCDGLHHNTPNHEQINKTFYDNGNEQKWYVEILPLREVAQRPAIPRKYIVAYLYNPNGSPVTGPLGAYRMIDAIAGGNSGGLDHSGRIFLEKAIDGRIDLKLWNASNPNEFILKEFFCTGAHQNWYVMINPLRELDRPPESPKYWIKINVVPPPPEGSWRMILRSDEIRLSKGSDKSGKFWHELRGDATAEIYPDDDPDNLFTKHFIDPGDGTTQEAWICVGQ